MTPTTTTGPELKAPVQDGLTLLWPEPPLLLEQTRENHRRLASAEVKLQNVPLAEVRRSQRAWVGHELDDQPLIATGHQIELYHPGVWAKDVLINELAARLSGQAYHFAVDTDAPKHLQLRWPGGSRPITDDARLTQADWAGTLETPTPQHLARLEAEFAASAGAWPFEPLAGRVLGSMRRLTLESPNLTWVLTNAIHQLDWDLGLRHHAMLASPVWMSPGYLLTAHHILAHAQRFAAVYNGVLAWFRRESMIRSPGRPWPDLARTGDRLEAPFWLDDLATGQRQRASVIASGSRWSLRHGDRSFEFDPALDGWESSRRLGQFLSQSLLRLSPRALTLTLFIRLLMADQFVHGIGGGRYDRITDRVIETFFGAEPPAFSVTTATLLFPTAAGQRRVDLRALEVEGRRIRHGWADPSKRETARRIADLPRRSRQRAELFYRMHESLDSRAAADAYHAWEHRLHDARAAGESQRDVFDRELFFAIQPEERLRMLIERYRHAGF